MTADPRLPPWPLQRRLSPAERERVAAWWRALDDEARRELDAPPRRRPRGVLVRLTARPVDPLEQAENELWTAQLREYVNGHDVPFFLQERTYHICRAHPAAGAVVESGVIPAGFPCPLGRAACPLAAAARAHPGRALHLVPAAPLLPEVPGAAR